MFTLGVVEHAERDVLDLARRIEDDRGRHDGLAYCRFRRDEPPRGLLEALEDWPYDHVFLLETLENFERREHTGRTSTRAESIEIAKVIEQTYRDYGMEVTYVPELSVEERADFVLEKMAEGRTKIREVFERLIAQPSEMPDAARARIEHDGLRRTVCDYVAGMTDRYLFKQ